MEPVSALSAAGVAVQLVVLCVSISRSLSNLKDKYDEVGKTLGGIKRYCKLIEFAVRKIQHWIETTVAASGVAVPELDALQSALQAYTEVLQDLKDDVDKVVGSADEDTLRDRQKLKFAWNQDVMLQHLKELHYLSSALHLLLDATQLPLGQLGQVVDKTQEYSQSISSSRRSLKSFQDLEPAVAAVGQFTFDGVLESSAVYQRAASYALAASVGIDDEADRSGFKVEGLTASSPSCTTPSGEAATPTMRGLPLLQEFRLPYPQNERFLGREDILDALHNALRGEGHETAIRTCALYGLDGIGKTQIALEYAYRHREWSSYDVVWWVRGESPTSIAISYSSISKSLELTTSTEPSIHVSLVRQWLGLTEVSWLLVFDDFDPEITQLQRFLPDSVKGQGSVIITTRRPEISGTIIEVPQWTMQEAISFLLELDIYRSSSISKEDMTAAEYMADELGCYPLALEHMMSLRKKNRTSLHALLELYTTYKNMSTDAPTYDRSLTETFSIAISDLSADATVLLQTLAFLDPNGLDGSSLLSEIFASDTVDIADGNHQPTLVQQELVSRSLVRIKRDSNSRDLVFVHRPLQNFILVQLSSMAGPAQDAFQHAVNFVRKRVPNTAEIKISSKEKLKLDAAFGHAVPLAVNYTRLQGVLQASVEFSTLLVESAACMARTDQLEGAKEVLGMANRTLEQLDVPANALRKRALTMQRFFDDWGV